MAARKTEKAKTPKKQKEPEVADADCIKLALWYIQKCGCPIRASRAFRAAAAALNALQKPPLNPETQSTGDKSNG